MTARAEPLAGLEAVLGAHWVTAPRGYANEVCTCGWESDLLQVVEGQAEAHLATALRTHLAATLAGAREDVAQAMRKRTETQGGLPYDDLPEHAREMWRADADAALSVIAARLGIEGET